MAADQLKKRLNDAYIVDCTSKEPYRVKRKKVGLLQYNLKMRSNIFLEWDENKKNVVARKEQIGISWRNLIPFIDAPQGHNVLADVFNVPPEIFDLDNLTEVLSFEVWQTCLSKNEKSLLSQLLTKGEEANMVVEELLAGSNLHFGNPLLKWGASLCSGDLHPNSIIHREMCLKANKKAYYLELQKYHDEMIGNLQMWKGRCASCKDPEREIVQKTWRSRKKTEKNRPIDANKSTKHDHEENLTATSESHSSASNDKACGSDQPSIMMLHGESPRRKEFVGGKYGNSLDRHKVVARPTKGEKFHKHNIQGSDVANYMSYIKVTKEQYERVKSSMKHTSNSIQSKSLNTVLGSLNTLYVQPFEKFEEEEEQNLHKHWLQIVNSSLPEGFANWRRLQLQKQQRVKLLSQELEEQRQTFFNEDEDNAVSLNMLQEDAGDAATDIGCTSMTEDEDNAVSLNMLQEDAGDGVTDIGCTSMTEDEENAVSVNMLQEDGSDGVTDIGCTSMTQDEESDEHDCVRLEQTDNKGTGMDEVDELVSASMQSKFIQQSSSLGARHEFPSMDMDSDGNHPIATIDNEPSNLPEYSENMKRVNITSTEGEPLSSGSNVWARVHMPASYYLPTSVSDEYTSASGLADGLSLGNPQVMDQHPAAGLINLESDLQGKNRGKDLLLRQDNDVSFLSPYPNQEQNELFSSYLKDQGSLPYQCKQKQTGLDYQPAPNVMMEAGQILQKQTRFDYLPASNVMMEAGQISGYHADHLCSSLPLEPRHKRVNNIYMHQNIDESIFSDVTRYSIPRGEHFSTTRVQDWNVNSIRMSVPHQFHLNSGELLSQSWIPVEHRPHSGWSHSEGTGINQRFGNGGNADQSLFSVISDCNQLQSSSPFDAMGSNERFIQSGNFCMGGGLPTGSSVLHQAARSLEYMNGPETADGIKTNSIGWMSLPYQSAAFQDSLSKQFSRSWNH